MKVWIVKHNWHDDLDGHGFVVTGVFDSFEKAKVYIDSVTTDDVNYIFENVYVRERKDETFADEGTPDEYVWCTTRHRYSVDIEGTEVK